MANKHVKKMLTPHAIKEMQIINTTWKYHTTPTKMTIIKETVFTGKAVENWTLYTLLVGM